MTADLHVVFGTGPLGTAVVRALKRRKKHVRVVNRSGRADVPESVEVVAADLTDTEGARAACDGAAVAYFCAQPPYTEWPALFPALLDGAIDAASAAGAKLVVADNCYMYGPVAGPITEDLPHETTGRKGRTRAAMANAAMEAHERGDVDVVIGRASDFFGPGVTESAIGERVFEPALGGKATYLLGDPDAAHTYTYIDDFAEGLVTLAEHDEAFGETWHVPSAETLTTREFVTLVYAKAGTEPRIRRVPSWLFRAVAPFGRMLREVRETLYEFEEPFVVDSSKFEAAFGADPTPHEAAIAETLRWYREARE